MAAPRNGPKLLREALTGLETGGREETGALSEETSALSMRAHGGVVAPPGPARVATLDGAGPLGSGGPGPGRSAGAGP
ncbi:hypothetical protein SSPO_094260 [Streptomyces antimycoticus]|uniref:Uncharacterized protein n=1 Tax=Streptomyces antimycoticus TaxID=68175 RepID=A0A499V2U7_9ACTN|nr:hypothetical protein [Streptomyces antimycoticus]BBJ46708.1 hypothetical protein SSPO_094260 [Streptomyces antimycoticus]